MPLPPALDGWCRRTLGAAVARHIFTAGHLGTVVGIGLDDGRTVVVKIRPSSERLQAVIAVQRHLHEGGVPCPRPLLGPLPFGDQAITVETYEEAETLPATVPPAGACAELLATVVEAAPPAAQAAGLAPAPPWVGWDHPGDGTWPEPDDLLVDMNAGDGRLDWIDGPAATVRRRLCDDRGAPVVGHVDWEAQNLGWDGDRPVVAYDWDSLAVRTEAALAGAASAVFASTTGTTVAATAAQSAAFLEAYQRRRGAFSPAALHVAWAAGLWVLLYNAKKESLGGGPGYLSHLAGELDERLSRC